MEHEGSGVVLPPRAFPADASASGRSGKRIDGAKKEIDELYDEMSKLKVRLAQAEGQGRAASSPSSIVSPG